MGAGAQARRRDDTGVPESLVGLPGTAAKPRSRHGPRPGGATHDVGSVRGSGMAGPADDPSLGLLAAQPRAGHARSRPGEYPAGARAVQVARTTRYADGRRKTPAGIGESPAWSLDSVM